MLEPQVFRKQMYCIEEVPTVILPSPNCFKFKFVDVDDIDFFPN